MFNAPGAFRYVLDYRRTGFNLHKGFLKMVLNGSLCHHLQKQTMETVIARQFGVKRRCQ
jgi:hypothetical protein